MIMVGDDCRRGRVDRLAAGGRPVNPLAGAPRPPRQPAATVRDERAKVATEGWGAKLISLQDHDGRWGGGDYTPKWISTTYTLLHLVWLGLPPGHPAASPGVSASGSGRADGGCRRRALSRCWCGSPPLTGTTPNVSTASSTTSSANSSMTAAGTAQRTATLPSTAPSTPAFRLLRRLTSINVLAVPRQPREAQARGRDFFLRHQLYKSHRTGQLAIRGSTRFPQLPQWHFDVLRGLEHFVDVAADRDQRLGDAVGVLLRARRADGRWPTYAAYPGPLGSRWRNRVRAVERYSAARSGWWGRPGTRRAASEHAAIHSSPTPPMPPAELPQRKAAPAAM